MTPSWTHRPAKAGGRSAKQQQVLGGGCTAKAEVLTRCPPKVPVEWSNAT